MSTFLWVIFPYLCLAVFVVGHWWRYKYDKFGWTTRSSQLYEDNLLKWGSPLFHFGMLGVVGGHIIGLLLPGFEIHGSYHLLGFEKAHRVHTMTVWAFIGLWVFAMFWHLTTGEWRQYIPTMKNIDKIVRF